MLKCIGKLISINGKRELELFMEQTRAELLTISKTKTEIKTLEYFDFVSWLDSKIEHRPYAEIIREKAKRVKARSD